MKADSSPNRTLPQHTGPAANSDLLRQRILPRNTPVVFEIALPPVKSAANSQENEGLGRSRRVGSAVMRVETDLGRVEDTLRMLESLIR
jgi:hypothetical protein